MPLYCCRFVSATGEHLGEEHIEAEREIEACVVAHEMLAKREHASGFELWAGKHCIDRYRR
jgi:hypothetical protein